MIFEPSGTFLVLRVPSLPETGKTQGGARWRALDKHAAVCRKLGCWSDAVADLRSGGISARDPAAEARLVDLAAFYNLEFGGGDLEKGLTGIRTCDGIQFDARGCLFLASVKHFSDRVPRPNARHSGGVEGTRNPFHARHSLG